MADAIVTDHSSIPDPKPEAHPVDRAFASLRYAESMTLVLQSYLASADARDCAIDDAIMGSYCCALLEQIGTAKQALKTITAIGGAP